MKHVLKADMKPFAAVWNGNKKAEVRFDDRGYKPGHLLEIYEMCEERPTGRWFVGQVSHIQRGYGLPEQVVVLSLGFVSRGKSKRHHARDRLGIAHDHVPAQAELRYSEMVLE